MTRQLRRTLWLSFAALTIWSLGYGPLLPWSPIRPGFRTVDGKRVTLVYPDGYLLPAALRTPDELLSEAEAFHRLPVSGRITIFLCPDWPTAYRVLPRLAKKGVGAITLATGSAIYVLPTIAERQLDPVEFVRHELSHAVLHQNQSLLNAVRLGEIQWLAEGIAVWFGRQKAYITEEEFLRMAPTQDVAAYIDPSLRERLPGPFDIRFGYVCWHQFNAYLAASGPDRYWTFVHATIANPRHWRALFARHFHHGFDEAVNAFAQQVKREAEAARPSPVGPPNEPHKRHSQLPPQSPR